MQYVDLNTRRFLRMAKINPQAADAPNQHHTTGSDESRLLCCHVSRKKAALEHTAKTTADGQLACLLCACERDSDHVEAVFSDSTLANAATNNQEYVT